MIVVDSHTIETEHLVLRPPVGEDFDAYTAMWGDPEVTRYITGAALDREASWRMFLRDAGHWSLHGFGFFTAMDRETQTFAGVVGLAHLERNIEPPFGDSPEAGWAFAAPFHGKGLASEALRSVLQWGEAQLLATRFVCMINETNAASARVAQKCGFRKFAATQYHGANVILHERKS